jgi:rubrerythrin
MSRYIDKDALIAEFKRLTLGENSLIERIFADGVYAVIDTFPTADVVEVRHGRWIKQKQDTELMQKFHDMGLGQGMSVNSIYWTCSLCGNWGTPHYKYCPNCGSKMDGERSENGT